MNEKKFVNKEAIDHGWKMSKKYLKTVLLFGFIYFLFVIVNGVLEKYAGLNVMTESEVTELYPEKEEAKAFYKFVETQGYINSLGFVQEKLKQATSADKLELSIDYENNREAIFQFFGAYRYQLPFPKPLYYLLAVILWVINMLISIGLLRGWLMFSRDQQPTIDVLFNNWRFFVPFLIAGICFGVATVLGLILLIIPGIIVILTFGLYPYLIIDKDLGPIESLKRSRVITEGSKRQLAVFGLQLFLLNIIGLLCLIVGVFFTMAVSSIAIAYVYDRLENSETPPETTDAIEAG